jgi:predicted CXXCH cytochrome family protein
MKTLFSSRWHQVLAVPLSVLLIGTGLLFSAPASAQIASTAHDFSTDLWNATGEICVVCHAPHNTVETAEQGGTGSLGPLWNRTLSAVNNYSVYSSAGRAGSFLEASTVASQSTNPTGVSKLCLSCHDGTIAIDSFGRAGDGTPFTGGTTFMDDINVNFNIGEGSGINGNLSNDHPVAFQFPTTDAEIYAFANGFVSAGPNPDVLPLFGGLEDQLECATCHDVHGTGNNKLLRVDNAGSGLCLSCHIK